MQEIKTLPQILLYQNKRKRGVSQKNGYIYRNTWLSACCRSRTLFLLYVYNDHRSHDKDSVKQRCFYTGMGSKHCCLRTLYPLRTFHCKRMAVYDIYHNGNYRQCCCTCNNNRIQSKEQKDKYREDRKYRTQTCKISSIRKEMISMSFGGTDLF